MAKWRALLRASARSYETTDKTDKTPELRSSERVLSGFGSGLLITEKRLSVGPDGQYAPDHPCPACGLRLWWQRPDGLWVCGLCTPDPVKCRQCDRPNYSHLAWPMVCERWEATQA
jgi:hypothetical protein